MTVSRFRPRSAPTKSATKSSAGRAEHRGRRVVLLELAALGEDRDPVAHPHRLVDVVGDEHDRLAQLALQPQELVLQPVADDRVDRAERLVHQQHRRVGGERAGHADPLALAAGELVRVAARRSVAGSRPTSSSSSSTRARDLRFGPSRAARHGGDVGGDRLVREQPDLLDHVADPPAQLRPGRRAVTSSPSRKIRPLVGSISRLIIFSVVDLPQPDGPTSTTISPAGTSRSSSCTATVPSA